MYTTRPQEPHSRSTSETQASFSSSVEPKSAACLPRLSDSSQKTQRLHRLGRSSRLSRVSAATCQDKPTSGGEEPSRTGHTAPPAAPTSKRVDRSRRKRHPTCCDRCSYHDDRSQVPPFRLSAASGVPDDRG